MGAIIERSERYGHYYGRYYPVNIGNNGTAETYNDHYKNKMLEATIDYSARSATTNCKPSPVTRSARKVRKATTR